MENEWIAGIILSGLMCFCVMVTFVIKRARQKLHESEVKKETLKRGIVLIKQRWKQMQNGNQ